jgi:serine phosphatase RsbU (regulator of sigma subunit)
MYASLNVVLGKEQGREYKLAEEKTLLGRGRECGIVIDDVAASRRHAQIVLEDDRYSIEDLKSTNRTFVNGKGVAGKQRLADNDSIRIGETQFVFRFAAPAALATEEVDDMSTVLGSHDLSPGSDVVFRGNAQAKLRAILQISQALGQTLDLDVLLDTMLGGLFEIFPQSSRALVLLRDGPRLAPRAVKHRENDEGSVLYSRTIVNRVMEDRQAILSRDAVHDERFASTQSIVNLQIRSVMCVPVLPLDCDALGVIQLETQQAGAQFNDADAQILASVAVQVAVFIQYARLHDDILRQSRLQRELELAELVQQDFLPQVTPELDDYRFWAYYLAAGRVGGDYYDFLALPNGNHAVLLGDVSGKGVPAALRMAKASAACKVALLSHPDDVAQAVAAMNREICINASRGGFITLAMCVIDPRSNQFTVVNAGHPSPLLRRPDGTIVELAGPKQAGLPLGVVEEQEYPTRTFPMHPGDVVVLYSDGISEAANAADRLYSARRVRKVVMAEKGRSPAATGEALIADVRRYAGDREQSDDISLVVFGRSAGDDW